MTDITFDCPDCEKSFIADDDEYMISEHTAYIKCPICGQYIMEKTDEERF